MRPPATPSFWHEQVTQQTSEEESVEVDAPEKPCNPSPATGSLKKKTTLRSKITAKLARRPPTPPRIKMSKRAPKGRASGDVKPKLVVIPPRLKVKEQIEELSTAEAVEVAAGSPVKRAVKSGTAKRGGSLGSSFNPKDTSLPGSLKRAIPPPPVPPQKARGAVTSESERHSSSPSTVPRLMMRPTPKVRTVDHKEVSYVCIRSITRQLKVQHLQASSLKWIMIRLTMLLSPYRQVSPN